MFSRYLCGEKTGLVLVKDAPVHFSGVFSASLQRQAREVTLRGRSPRHYECRSYCNTECLISVIIVHLMAKSGHE